MKRAALVTLLAISTILIMSQSADAGTGKGKAKIDIRNSNAAGGRAITIFIVPEGKAAPTTKAQALALSRKNVAAGKTEGFVLKNGSYTVGAADTAAFGSLGNNDPIPAGSFASKAVFLNDKTVNLTTNTPAGATLPFRPNLN